MKNNKSVINNTKFFKKCLAVLGTGGICLTFTGCDDATIEEIKTWVESLENVSINIYIDGEQQEFTTTAPASTTTSETTTTELTTDYTSFESTTTTTYVSTDFTTSDMTTYLSTGETTTTTTTTTINNQVSNGKVGLYAEEEEYLAQEGDTLYSLAIKFNTTVDDLKKRSGLDSNELIAGKTIIKYGVLNQYAIYEKSDSSLNSFATRTCSNLDDIKNLNNIPEGIERLEKQTSLIIRRLVGKQDYCYDSLGYKLNLYQGTLIYGDELAIAEGFVGASNIVLSFIGSPSGNEFNHTALYRFDGAGNYDVYDMAANVKGIGEIDGIPVIYIRKIDDIMQIARETGASSIDHIKTCLFDLNNPDASYTIYSDQNGELFIPFDAQYGPLLGCPEAFADEIFVCDKENVNITNGNQKVYG